MSRLLLGDDLVLYEDGTVSGRSPETPVLRPAELPYYDPRYVGRSLTVAADGTLTWRLDEPIPVVDASKAGAILTVNARGMAEWTYAIPGPGGGPLADEVVTSDGVGLGILYYGTDTPLDPLAGALWAVTRRKPSGALPPAPTAAPTLSAPVVTGTSVKLDWTSVATATKYEVRMDGAPIQQVDGLTYTVDLTENVSRTFKVAALNTGGFGPESNSRVVAIPNAAPPAPTNLRVTTNVSGSFVVAFDYTPPSDFASYIVTTSAGTAVTSAPGKTVTVNGAPDDSQVAVSIKARDAGGLDSAEVTIIVSTAATPAPSAPAAPTGLHTTRVGYASADLAWTGSAGADSYEVSGDGVNFGSVGPSTVYAWSGLSQSSSYTFYVRARNTGGASGAALVTFATLPQVARYDYTYRDRTFGYGGEMMNQAGIGYRQSGVGFTVDHWANAQGTNNWLYTVDNNTNTGPYSANPGRFIDYSFSLNFVSAYWLTLWWGFPGTCDWYAYDVNDTVVQHGQAVCNAVGSISINPNVVNAPNNLRIAHILIIFSAGGGAGAFKLREWSMVVKEVTAITPVYNPA